MGAGTMRTERTTTADAATGVSGEPGNPPSAMRSGLPRRACGDRLDGAGASIGILVALMIRTRTRVEVNATRMAYTPRMGAYRRGSLVAGLALLAAACSLVAPLDGLTGGAATDGGSGTDQASSSGGGDAISEPTADARADGTASIDASGDVVSGSSSGVESGGGDAPADVAHDGGLDAPPDAPSSLYRAAVLADSPLAYWRLGETGGTVAHDESGHGHDGTYVGGTTLGQPGALTGDPDTCARFDGTTGQVDVGAIFDFAGTTPFSLEAWVYATLLDTTYRHVVTQASFNSAGNPVDGTYLILYSGTTDFGFERWSASTAVLAVDVNAYPGVNQWVHVVATFDGSIGTVYVDGTAVGAETTQGAAAASGVHMLWGNLLQGELDEVAVYGAALPQARITAHYQAAK